jgi:hypothetical protein
MGQIGDFACQPPVLSNRVVLGRERQSLHTKEGVGEATARPRAGKSVQLSYMYAGKKKGRLQRRPLRCCASRAQRDGEAAQIERRLSFFRARATRPTRPVPSSIIDAGSGTTAGADEKSAAYCTPKS